MRAKKSLGQNFLTSKRALAQIIRAASLAADDTVLEIGPGRGALTRALLATGAHVIAVEKDAELIPLLSETFAQEIKAGQLTVLNEDILAFDPHHALRAKHYKLVANIPYYITGEILRRFLSETAQPERMVLLVQKEVAERIVARDGKESILSLSVKAFGTPKLIATVPARDFSPAPKVDSAILAITDISTDRLPDEKERRFFELIRRAFGQKRKQLASTIPPLVPKEVLLAFLDDKKLPRTARPEELDVKTWVELADRS